MLVTFAWRNVGRTGNQSNGVGRPNLDGLIVGNVRFGVISTSRPMAMMSDSDYARIFLTG
jgi:hypothetical protein